MRYRTVGLAAVTLSVLFATERSSNAHKQYMDAFKTKYPKVAMQVDAQKCRICHGKFKVERSPYAKALESALAGKKINNIKAINAALDKVAVLKSEVPNKTYGDLLDEGDVPPPFKTPLTVR